MRIAVVVGQSHTNKCLVAKFDGYLWSVDFSFPDIIGKLRSVHACSIKDIWVCGGTGVAGDTTPILYHFNGSWVDHSSDITDAVYFESISGNKSNDIWVTGKATGIITSGAWNFDGTSWAATKTNTIDIGYTNKTSVSAEGHCYHISDGGAIGGNLYSNKNTATWGLFKDLSSWGKDVVALTDSNIICTLNNGGYATYKYDGSWAYGDLNRYTECIAAKTFNNYVFVETVDGGGTAYLRTNASTITAISISNEIVSIIGCNNGSLCLVDNANIWACACKWNGHHAGWWTIPDGIPQLSHWEGGVNWSSPTDYNVANLNASQWCDISSPPDRIRRPHVPTGGFWLDRGRKDTAAMDPVVANRLPAPILAAKLETTSKEPFDLEANSILSVTTPAQASISSITGPFDLEDGDTLTLRINNGPEQTVTLTGLTPGAATVSQIAASIHSQIRYAKCAINADGTTFSIKSNASGSTSAIQITGGTAVAILGFDYEIAYSYPTNGFEIASNSAPFAITDGSTLLVQIDGGSSQTVTLSGVTGGAATAAQIVAASAGQIVGGKLFATDNGAKVVLKSNSRGTIASVKVAGGTAQAGIGFDGVLHAGENINEEFTFTAASGYEESSLAAPYALLNGDTLLVSVDGGLAETVTFSTGDFVDIGAASAAEVAAVVTATLAAATATATSSRTKITITSNCEGISSSIQVTGGTAIAKIGFDGLLHSGSGDFLDISTATAAEIIAVIVAATSRLTTEESGSGGIIIRSAINTALQVTSSESHTANTGLDFPETTSDLIIAVAESNQTICLDVFEIGSSGFDYVKIWVTRLNDGKLLVYDSTGPTVAPNWSVVASTEPSIPGGTDDVWRLTLTPDAGNEFTSEDHVIVAIEAATLAPLTQTFTHEFDVEDWTEPVISKIVPRACNLLRVRFSEAMQNSTNAVGDTNWYRDVSGRAQFHATYTIGITEYSNVIEAPTADFDSDEAGMFVGVYNAQSALNNGSHEILEVLSSELIRVGSTLENEGPADLRLVTPPVLIISPYRLVRIEPTSTTIQPSFQPIITSARAVGQTEINPAEDSAEYIDLTLQDAPTAAISYKLQVAGVKDTSGNAIAAQYVFTFTSFSLSWPTGRAFNLWNMIPQWNKDSDVDGDTERLVKVLNETAQLMLYSIDQFGLMFDSQSVSENALDTILQHLGNPFSFVNSLTVQKKRDLLPILVQLYKKKGTSIGIQNAISFFLGKTVTVTPWFTPLDTWELGTSELGFNTYLGPSDDFVRYAFYIDHQGVSLDDDEKTIIRQIVHFCRPAHTHFLGFSDTSAAPALPAH